MNALAGLTVITLALATAVGTGTPARKGRLVPSPATPATKSPGQAPPPVTPVATSPAAPASGALHRINLATPASAADVEDQAASEVRPATRSAQEPRATQGASARMSTKEESGASTAGH